MADMALVLTKGIEGLKELLGANVARTSQTRHSGMVRRTRPGISRFRVRCFASPRNDDGEMQRLAMRLRIGHSTNYRYEPPASGVIQILRMTPGSHDGQYVAEWQIYVSTDSRLDMHQDAFG